MKAHNCYHIMFTYNAYYTYIIALISRYDHYIAWNDIKIGSPGFCYLNSYLNEISHQHQLICHQQVYSMY